MIQVIGIPAFKDNYIWLVYNSETREALVVDPGEAAPVLKTLQEHQLTPIGLLITHHHWDHTGGIGELVSRYNIPVYGGDKEPIENKTHPLKESDTLHFPGLVQNLQIIEVPGHTLGHIAYYGDGKLFSGDTLFTAGAGKLYEGTAEQMTSSLTKLKSLPPDTLIYCGHEYTESNLRFASIVEPQNKDIAERTRIVKEMRLAGAPTVPAPLALELKTNPFLRTHTKEVKEAADAYAGHSLVIESDIFLTIRTWKNTL